MDFPILDLTRWDLGLGWTWDFRIGLFTNSTFILCYENYDIAIAMSSSCADPILGLNILQG